MSTPGDTRLKFSDFEFVELPSGQCRAKVVLKLDGGREFVGEAEGLSSPAGNLRTSAQAAVEALENAVRDHRLSLELLGVKAVRAFDAIVVIVSLSSQTSEEPARLIGSCLIRSESPARGAALAVLNATNRLLGDVFYSSEKH